MRSVQAPIASNPFAASGVAPSLPQAPYPHGAPSPTGPTLGKGSELQRVYAMPDTMGHDERGITCMALVDDVVYTGGRDSNLFAWRGEPAPGGDFQLKPDRPEPIVMNSSVCSLFYEPASKWLFCGLWNGEIMAYCKEPAGQDVLTGHRRSVSSIVVHSSVVVSGSNDSTVRLWTMNPQSRRFEGHGQPLQNPSGAVHAVRVLSDGLWVGAQGGITCFDLNTLQPRGTIASQHPVTNLLELQGHMLATYRNGDVKIFDAGGSETYNFPSRGEHTSNTAVATMMHPTEKKPMLLCGQSFGYVTAYDLPDFRPRGSWVCKHNSDVRAILDVGIDGLFMTAGGHSDVMVWRWTGQTGGASGVGGGACGGAAAPVASNPFAPGGGQAAAAPVAASPFGGGCGGFGGDSMM